MELSVVVPVKHEQENMLSLLDEIHTALESRCKFKVIYINGGSTDKTSDVPAHAMQTFPRLRALTHAQSAAVMSGTFVIDICRQAAPPMR